MEGEYNNAVDFIKVMQLMCDKNADRSPCLVIAAFGLHMLSIVWLVITIASRSTYRMTVKRNADVSAYVPGVIEFVREATAVGVWLSFVK